MSKSLLGMATLVALLFSSTGYAGFTTFGGGEVHDLGSFTFDDIRTNKFDRSGKLVSYDGQSIPTGEPEDEYTTLLPGGTYRVALVDGTDEKFSLLSTEKIVGVLASNALWTSTNPNGTAGNKGFNVLGQLLGKQYERLRAEIGNALDVNQSFVENQLLGDGTVAMEIADPNGGGNPDEAKLRVRGHFLKYFVNTARNNQEISLVLATPEPTTLAVWGLCSVGGVIAGRRRLRKAVA